MSNMTEINMKTCQEFLENEQKWNQSFIYKNGYFIKEKRKYFLDCCTLHQNFEKIAPLNFQFFPCTF